MEAVTDISGRNESPNPTFCSVQSDTDCIETDRLDCDDDDDVPDEDDNENKVTLFRLGMKPPFTLNALIIFIDKQTAINRARVAL